MKSHFAFTSLILGASLVLVQAQGSIQITFDGPPVIAPGSAVSVRDYTESGMWFETVAEFADFGRIGVNPTTARPDDGSAYLQGNLLNSLQFSFTGLGQHPTNTLFSLISVDLAEYSTGDQSPITVDFTGYRQDGSTVTTSFTTDGIIDGSGPLADFETFYFGPEFSSLTRVEIPSAGWSMDNLVFRPVPEPAPLALGLTGGLLLWFLKRCRARRNST